MVAPTTLQSLCRMLHDAVLSGWRPLPWLECIWGYSVVQKKPTSCGFAVNGAHEEVLKQRFTCKLAMVGPAGSVLAVSAQSCSDPHDCAIAADCDALHVRSPWSL